MRAVVRGHRRLTLATAVAAGPFDAGEGFFLDPQAVEAA